ncbi:hypothetical protein RvY_07864 [Ramazzottius varieornatus]|uniref:Uncharacterized protein n=1 Tax=Ramazzottius varieornatus TaxID=947166 RepID=A0A1D1V8N9_RAMVA|nr:hypothetical protein RvY_07864 [Ramazzottius varieornatus]
MALTGSTATFKKIWDTGTSYLFAYETPKVVNIQSKRIGAMHRLVQIGIIAYVIGYVFIWNKGYQDVDHVESSVVTKVKGVLRSRTPYPMDVEIWDSVDFIVPSQENNAFFIATNVIATRNQRQGRCPEVHTDASELTARNACAWSICVLLCQSIN